MTSSSTGPFAITSAETSWSSIRLISPNSSPGASAASSFSTPVIGSRRRTTAVPSLMMKRACPSESWWRRIAPSGFASIRQIPDSAIVSLKPSVRKSGTLCNKSTPGVIGRSMLISSIRV